MPLPKILLSVLELILQIAPFYPLTRITFRFAFLRNTSASRTPTQKYGSTTQAKNMRKKLNKWRLNMTPLFYP
jgi:hypothetical protein